MFVVEVDGEAVAEIGPGAVVGERASVEGRARTATLRAKTRARAAEATPEAFDPEDLGDLASAHQARRVD